MKNGSSPGLAVLYDRASTIGQRNNWSRDDAARFLDKVVADHGYRGEIRQEIRSGESLVNRPVMKRLLEEIAEGKVAALVCQDFSRLSRDEDGIDGRIIRQVCRDAGCLIITQEKVYDFSNDSDDLLADLNFFVGKIHKRQSILALTRGLKEKARQGKLQPTYARYGYDWSERWADDGSEGGKPGAKKPGAELVVVPEEADIVRRIFDLYEEMSQRKVALALNAEGLRKPVKSRAWRTRMITKTGGRKYMVEREQEQTERLWTPKDIFEIVTNKLYAGIVVWGENCRSRFLGDFEGVQHFRPDLQIVSLEQFNRVQRITQERRRMPAASVSSPYLFSGLLRCRHCQGRTVGRRQRRKRAQGDDFIRIYACRSFHELGSQACKGQQVYEDVVKAAVLPALLDLLENRLSLDATLEEVARELAAPTTPKRREEHLAELSQLDVAEQRLVDAVAQGLLRPEAIRQKQLDIMERRQALQRKLAALEDKAEKTGEVALVLDMVRSDLGSLLEGAPHDQLARLVRLVYRWFTVELRNGNRHTPPELADFEFTPEFSELLGTDPNDSRPGRKRASKAYTIASDSSPFDGVGTPGAPGGRLGCATGVGVAVEGAGGVSQAPAGAADAARRTSSTYATASAAPGSFCSSSATRVSLAPHGSVRGAAESC